MQLTMRNEFEINWEAVATGCTVDVEWSDTRTLWSASTSHLLMMRYTSSSTFPPPTFFSTLLSPSSSSSRRNVTSFHVCWNRKQTTCCSSPVAPAAAASSAIKKQNANTKKTKGKWSILYPLASPGQHVPSTDVQRVCPHHTLSHTWHVIYTTIIRGYNYAYTTTCFVRSIYVNSTVKKMVEQFYCYYYL